MGLHGVPGDWSGLHNLQALMSGAPGQVWEAVILHDRLALDGSLLGGVVLQLCLELLKASDQFGNDGLNEKAA